MKLIVGVADMKVTSQPDDLMVTHGLGSCLGLAVHDAAAHVGGMLHVMMPMASANPEKAKANPFMFVDTGVPAFFDALQAAGAMRRRWRLIVTGGATVTGNDYFAIGKRNYITLKKILWKAGVLVHAEEVGGQIARTLHLDNSSGRVWLSNAGRDWDL